MSKSTINAADLPMAAHTSVLGVDIMAHQEAMWADVHEGGHSGGLEAGIEIETWTGKPYRFQHIRKELAHWARRNLFDGAGPA
jgi:hypothetical protein